MKNENEIEFLIESFFDEFYYYFSSYATLRGIHRYDYKLSSYDPKSLNTFKSYLTETLTTLRPLEEKYKKEHAFELRTLYKIISNTLEFIGNGLKNNPQIIFYDALLGLICSVVTPAKQMNIKSRNFTQRINDLKELPKVVRAYVNSISKLERETILSEIDHLTHFINEYASFLLTKSDTEKKEEIKLGRTSVLESFNELRTLVKALPDRDELYIRETLRVFNLENVDFIDIKSYLSEQLSYFSERIIRKAREIKIASPYFETVKEVLSTKTSINDAFLNETLKKLKPYIPKFFAGFTNDFETKIIMKESKIIEVLENNSLNIIPTGEFERKKTLEMFLKTEENPYKISYQLFISLFGKTSINFFRQNSKGKKKYLLNPLLYEGLPIFIRRIAFEDIKSIFDRSFELLYYYYEYALTLQAYILNEFYFRNWSSVDVEKFVTEDKILIDKEMFLKNVMTGGLKSFIGMEGVYFINEIRNNRLKLNDLVLKLLQNSYYPFYLIDKAIK